MKKAFKFCISMLAIWNTHTLSTEKPTRIINIIDNQFSPQTQNIPAWFINATWAGCDNNASIAYCDEMVAKNQTNSTGTCFLIVKGCCEGNSTTGFINCPPSTDDWTLFFYTFAWLSPSSICFYFVVRCIHRYTQKEKQVSIAGLIAALTMLGLNSVFYLQSKQNGENDLISLAKMGASFFSGTVIGCSTFRLLRWMGCPRPTAYELKLIQEPQERACCPRS